MKTRSELSVSCGGYGAEDQHVIWVQYNIRMTVLDSIHIPVFYLKHDVLKTAICLRLQVEPTQLDPIDSASHSLSGDRN
jgi:hypothetical protein